MAPSEIRPARLDDLDALTAIYGHWVVSSHATFDERPPTPEERRPWLLGFTPAGPYRLLVAEGPAGLLGYASSGRYRDHPAFRETVETSVYLAPAARGKGVGASLYAALFEAIRGEPVHRALAAVALPNPASLALHRRFGFREVGTFHEYARKGAARVSSVWLEKALDGAW